MKKLIQGISLALLFSLIVSFFIKWMSTGNPLRTETILMCGVIFLNIVFTGLLGYYIFRNFIKKPTSQIKKQLLPTFLLFTLAALIISLVLVSFGVYTFYQIKGLDTSNFMNQLVKVELSSAIKQFSIWILLGSIVFFYVIWRKAIDAEQALREENLHFKYRSLKTQVNPHFLFNSLNTLSELVYEDAKIADHYIQKLSSIYRYVLENEETELVPLKAELDFVCDYFSLQEIRDKGRVFLEINVNEQNHCLILPVSIQLLVENAIKHNAMSVENPLEITIRQEDKQLIISNNKQKKSILESTTKTGLQNLKERVRLYLNRELVIEEKENEFVVKIPIIEVKE